MSRILNPDVHLRGLRTLIRLAPAERGLLLRAVLLVGMIRLALWIVPLRRVRQLMRACEGMPLSVAADLPVSSLEWAVRAASRCIPMASCLTQSLALQFLLMRAGRSSQLHIGVRKDPQTVFQSHAWVECAGCTLLSKPSDLVGYSRILALEDLSN